MNRGEIPANFEYLPTSALELQGVAERELARARESEPVRSQWRPAEGEIAGEELRFACVAEEREADRAAAQEEMESLVSMLAKNNGITNVEAAKLIEERLRVKGGGRNERDMEVAEKGEAGFEPPLNRHERRRQAALLRRQS